MMVVLFLEGRYLGFYLCEFGICVVCSMSIFIIWEGKGEFCVGKYMNFMVMNGLIKVL